MFSISQQLELGPWLDPSWTFWAGLCPCQWCCDLVLPHIRRCQCVRSPCEWGAINRCLTGWCHISPLQTCVIPLKNSRSSVGDTWASVSIYVCQPFSSGLPSTDSLPPARVGGCRITWHLVISLLFNSENSSVKKSFLLTTRAISLLERPGDRLNYFSLLPIFRVKS